MARCIGFIPDGNRRWARREGLPTVEGHRRGLVNGRCIIQAAFECGVQHVVVWGASESNLKQRSGEEVANLFNLLKLELRERLRRTDKVQFRLVGNWRSYNMDPHIPDLLEVVEKKTASYGANQLTVLFGYDGERDNEQAVQHLHYQGLRPTRELIRQHLWTAHLPDVDLIIRTGIEGDPHESDAFLPWQKKNAQLIFSPLLSPEYGEEHLRAALNDFAGRERRMGT